MKRLIAIVLLAGLIPNSPARAADHLPGTVIPTAPSVPAPVLEKGGAVLPPSGSPRVLPHARERVAPVHVQAQHTASPMPLPTGYQTPVANGGGCATGDCVTADCGTAKSRGACLDRFKAWFCFRPTTGDALPIFNPAPYVGPITLMFPCTSAAGACASGKCGTANGCASGDGCATGGCRKGLGGLFGGRGTGGCVPPGDGAFPGYHFAHDRGAGLAAPIAAPVPVPAPAPAPAGSTSYKPAPSLAQPLARVAPQPAAGAVPQSKDKSGPSLLRWASWPAR